MKTWRLSIAALPLLLAACGGAGTPDPKATETTTTVAAAAITPVAGPERRILAFGDSLFAGYGLKEGQGYPEQLQAALRAAGINAVVANAGVSGDTTGAGAQRLAFTLDAQKTKPDLVLLELGANDMLRGLPPGTTRANFDAMLGELKKRQIPVLIMGMRAPPNYGPEYQKTFDAMYPSLAKEYGAKLVPFWLEAIYQEPTLFQADRLHPTVQGVAKLVQDTQDEVQDALPPTGKAD